MRILRTFLASLMVVCFLTVPAYAENGESKPLYAKDIKAGTYDIEVESSSSMFRVVACKLTVTDDGMTAVMTMSGQGYGKLFMGTGEEALSADESSYIPFFEGDNGEHCFTVPVAALDTTVQCAAWSIKREQWYDRDLVFRSDSLPEGALKSGTNFVLIAVIAGCCAVAAAVTVIVIKVSKKQKKKNDE